MHLLWKVDLVVPLQKLQHTIHLEEISQPHPLPL